MTTIPKRRWNAMLWIGFALAVLAFVTYFSLFVEFPLTRNFPWVNLLLFGLAAVLLVLGMGRAVRQPELYRGKIFGSVFAGLSVLIFALFIFTIFVAARRLPASASAPHVGGTRLTLRFPIPKVNRYR
jgi:hypothetical protein